MQPPYKVPAGWDKGEPLNVVRISETCYRLFRSGSYINEPGSIISKEVPYLEFRSRVETVDFQQWWDTPLHEPRVMLTRKEFLEYVQEMLDFAPRRGSTVSILPGSPHGQQLCAAVSEHEAQMLREYHSRYAAEVAQVLNIRD